MPTFTYYARDESGRLVKGVLEAESQVALADRLRRMGYLVTRMEEAARGLVVPRIFRWEQGVPEEQLLLSCVELANMVEAGVPLIASLQTVGSQVEHPVLREALGSVAKEVEGGATFSQALTHYPEIFPKLMAGMVAVGEATGHLDTILMRFASMAEKNLSLIRTVRAAFLYPIILTVAVTAVIIFFATFVVPQFAVLFGRAGIPLPLPTRIVQFVGDSIRNHGVLLFFFGVAGVMGLKLSLRLPKVHLEFDRLLLRLPLAIGKVIHLTIVSRFSRTLSTLVGSGIPILAALSTAEGVIGNREMASEIRRVRTAVERGERIAVSLSAGKVFRPDAVQMIRVGEESGRLDIMLEKIADFYELRVNYFLKQMVTLLEPVLLVIMGGIVLLIMASLLLPMFDMVKVLRQGGFR